MPGVGAEHMEGKSETQGRRRDPQWANTTKDDRDLGAGTGRKRGYEQTREMVADAGTRSGAQSRAVYAGE